MRNYISTCLIIRTFFLSPLCSGKQFQYLFEHKNNITATTSKRFDIEVPSAHRGSYTAWQKFQLEYGGTIALPAIGRMKITNLTSTEAAKQIGEFYRKKLFKTPGIELKVVNLSTGMPGEIKGRENYPLTKDRTTLIKMTGEAGGLTAKADKADENIIRDDQQDLQVAEIKLRNIRSIVLRFLIGKWKS